MPENLSMPNPENTNDEQSRWDSLDEDTKWLEAQAEKAKEQGDEQTLQKIGRYLEQNAQIAAMLTQEETIPEQPMEEAPGTEAELEGTEISANDLMGEEQKAQSKRYERTFQNPDGTIISISADTEEELYDKIREQNEANREAYGRGA